MSYIKVILKCIVYQGLVEVLTILFLGYIDIKTIVFFSSKSTIVENIEGAFWTIGIKLIYFMPLYVPIFIVILAIARKYSSKIVLYNSELIYFINLVVNIIVLTLYLFVFRDRVDDIWGVFLFVIPSSTILLLVAASYKLGIFNNNT